MRSYTLGECGGMQPIRCPRVARRLRKRPLSAKRRASVERVGCKNPDVRSLDRWRAKVERHRANGYPTKPGPDSPNLLGPEPRGGFGEVGPGRFGEPGHREVCMTILLMALHLARRSIKSETCPQYWMATVTCKSCQQISDWGWHCPRLQDKSGAPDCDPGPRSVVGANLGNMEWSFGRILGHLGSFVMLNVYD